MAINPVQLVGLQRQTPDFVGQFLRGKEFAANQDRQNRILGMQEQQFASQQEQAEAARRQAMEQAETNFFGQWGDMLATVPEEQRQMVYDIGRNMAKANGIQDADRLPQQYDPQLAQTFQTQARLKGYQTPAPEGQIGKLDPGQYTPQSLAQFNRTGNYADLQPQGGDGGEMFAKIDPTQYTPESVSRFSKTGDYADLQFRDQGPKAEGPGETTVDKEFAKEYVKWNAAGGFADTQKQINQLREVQRALEGGQENLTGPIIGRTPDWVRSFVKPNSIERREAVEEVVQRNLREILGAQFTQAEGDRLIKRAFNDNLSEAENAKRVGRLIEQMETAAQQKADAMRYFQDKGTLAGWEGSLPTMSDFTSIDFADTNGGGGWSVEEVR